MTLTETKNTKLVNFLLDYGTVSLQYEEIS